MCALMIWRMPELVLTVHASMVQHLLVHNPQNVHRVP